MKTRNPNRSGSIRKRKDNRYEWRQMVNGVMRYEYADSLTELERKIEAKKDVPINRITASEWFARWLNDYVKPYKSKGTYVSYEQHYRLYIKPTIGHIKMNNIKRYDIMSVVSSMQGKSRATITVARNVMHSCFAAAAKEGIIKISPVTDIPIPRETKKKKKPLTKKSVSMLLEEMKNSRWIHAIKFFLLTGIRKGELVALEWSDINIKEKTISICRSYNQNGWSDTKNHEPRIVPLPDQALDVLTDQKKMLEGEMNPAIYRGDLVFPSRKGKLLSASVLLRVIKTYSNRIGIEATPHLLRHTYVYNVRDTLTLKELQKSIGHSTSTQTIDLYGDDVDMTSAARKITDVYNDILEAKTDEIIKIRGKLEAK